MVWYAVRDRVTSHTGTSTWRNIIKSHVTLIFYRVQLLSPQR